MKSFDRFRLKEEDVFNLDDIAESYNDIESHVEKEVNEWHRDEPNALISPFHRVYVGGFSQGGVMALHYSLQAKNVPAGTICFSGYKLKSTPLTNFRKLPILLMHGQKDPHIR